MKTRILLPLGLAGLLVTSSGCLIIPMGGQDSGAARRNITTNSAAYMQAGASNRMDVLLALGEPDAATMDERKFAYWAEKVDAYWVVAGTTGAAGGAIAREQYLIVQFDANGNVQSCQQIQRHMVWRPEKILGGPVQGRPPKPPPSPTDAKEEPVGSFLP